LSQAAAALERLRDLRGRLAEVAGAAAPSQDADPVVEEAEKGFREGLADDLNTPRALAAVFGFVRASNTLLDEGMDPARAASHLGALMRWDRVLGVLGEGPPAEPPEIASLVREREDARSRRDFARSDEIRRALQERGWLVEDTPSGPRLKRAPVA
jgi:cysteinyl-tRNA synthetase